MKKLLLTIAVCLMGITALAQKYYPTPDVNTGQVVLTANDYERVVLLNRENDLLQSRKTALTISVVGVSVSSFGTAVESPELIVIGGTVALVGGVWLLINEYKLIDIQKQINRKTILQINPNGLTLRF